MRVHLHFCLAIALFVLASCNDGRPAGNVRKIHEPVAPRQGPYVTVEPVGSVRLAGAPRHMKLKGNVLYAFLNEYGLATLDLADRAHPAVTSELAGQPGRIKPGTHRYFSGVVDGDRLLVADRYHGLATLSLADPLRPAYVSTAQVPGNQLSDVAVSNGNVFIANGGLGLAHVRLDAVSSSPVTSVLASFDFVTQSAFYPPHYLLLADNYTGGMQILDIRDPKKPALVHNFQFCGFCDSIEVFDGFVTIGGRQRGLMVVDMADPAHPFLATHFMGGFNTISAQKRWGEHRLIVGTHLGTLDVIDLTDPARPLWLARTSVCAPVYCFEIKDDILYIGTNQSADGQLRVFRLVEHR